jgi:drug/metabolite transporter (DMT)-like permease
VEQRKPGPTKVSIANIASHSGPAYDFKIKCAARITTSKIKRDHMKINNAGLILALLSMITAGASNYLYKRSTDAMGPVNTTFFSYLFSIVFAIILWLLFREKERVTVAGLFWPALLAIILFISVWTFNYAVQFIDVSVASTIRSLGFVITIVLAIFLSQEKLTTKDWIAVVFAVLALILFGTRNDHIK